MWEAGREQEDDSEEDFTEFMLNPALGMCGGTDDNRVSPEEVTKLRHVGLHKRSRAFPPLSVVSGVACFMRVLTNVVRKLRWERFPPDTHRKRGLHCNHNA